MRLALVFSLSLAGVLGSNVTKECGIGCRTQAEGTGPIENSRMKVLNMMGKKEEDRTKCYEEGLCGIERPAQSFTPCVNGMAGEFPCRGVDMMSFIPLQELGCNIGATIYRSSDIWGWTDPVTNKEYAIHGCEMGTSFVDVTDPYAPKVIGFLRGINNPPRIWRDMKVYRDHAFISSEVTDHGLQVFDLRQLRGLEPVTPIRQFQNTAWYRQFGSNHNVVINEDSGFLYAVGSRTCNAGLHVVDIRNPASPQFAGCFGEDGYVHDAQCVNYNGPDTRYHGREICFCYNEDSLTIVDVTVKSQMTMISRVGYDGYQYTHQGWLTEDQSHLLMDDELDEFENAQANTRTLVWSVVSLTNPTLSNSFWSTALSQDHNQYTLNGKSYQSNYCAGFRVLDVTAIPSGGEAREVAFFDLAPEPSCYLRWLGSWSNYPYFKSGNIVVTSIERGLFVLRLSDSA
jgi:choice-of-anchor B domain-containing protein